MKWANRTAASLLPFVPPASAVARLEPNCLSGQVVPIAMGNMLRDKDKKKVARVTEAVLKMKKLDLAALRRAYQEV